MADWTPIHIPPHVTASAEDIASKLRRVTTTLTGFSTDAKLTEADAILADVSKLAQALRLEIRGVQRIERARLRQAAAEAERAEAQNERISAQRIAAISSKGAM